MGGSPKAPVQSNAAQTTISEYQVLQDKLAYDQMVEADEQQRIADEAEAEQNRLLRIRQAEADAETEERTRRMKKGKADLLYKDALGTSKKSTDGTIKTGRQNLLLMGGA